jgi:hypothetical protein
MELVLLFYIIDEFCKEFEPKWRPLRGSNTYPLLNTRSETQDCRSYGD